MFGRDWKPARATIVARKNIPKNRTSSSYEFIADVQPDEGGPTFRATFRGPQSAYGFLAPQVGEVAPVFCDLRHQKVKFDTDDPSLRWDTGMKAEKAAFDAVRHGAAAGVVASPGTQAATPGTPAATPGTPADAEMTAADDAFQVAVAEMRSAIDAFKRAKDSGDVAEAGRLKPAVAAANAEVQRRNGEFQRLAALRPDWTSGRYPARPGASSESQDPLDRLQKLADLHDHGVLTDAEFAAEKAKILGAG